MITVTPVPLDEAGPELEIEVDAEPLVDEFVPETVPLVLELEPEEVVVEFDDETRAEVVDNELTLVLLLLLLALLVVLQGDEAGSVKVLADEEDDEIIEVELVLLLAVGAILVEVIPVLVEDELEAVVVVVRVELAWDGEGFRPATAPLPDELLAVLDSVPMLEEDTDVLFVALEELLVEPVLFVPLVELPEVDELELTSRDELLVDREGDEEVVQVVFEIMLVAEVVLIVMLAAVELVRMAVLLLVAEVEGVDGARVARYTAMPAIMMMTIIIAAPAVVEMALDS